MISVSMALKASSDLLNARISVGQTTILSVYVLTYMEH